ncbi:Hypothetical predicted protein [Lecanosticta acicola]|uniref:F-box domain-containing protein n=1 Tax=Lecanosticta acicola TaxID=111012 RepID=A0AAI8Z7J4_9PEZI|nr:Hypothetical predicted protein [Lecanosticta acicola]
MTPSADSPPQPSSTFDEGECHFFKIPVELRFNIYEYALTSVTIETDPSNLQTPAILGVCRSMRSEALPIWSSQINSITDKKIEEHSALAREMEMHKVGSDRSLTTILEGLQYICLFGRQATAFRVAQQWIDLMVRERKKRVTWEKRVLE